MFITRRAQTLAGLGRSVGHFERCRAHDFGDRATTEALGTDVHRFIGAGGRCDADALQIGAEFPPADASDLRTDTAQVLLLTARGNLVTNLGTFSADFAFPSHDLPLLLSFRPGRRQSLIEPRSNDQDLNCLLVVRFEPWNIPRKRLGNNTLRGRAGAWLGPNNDVLTLDVR